MRHSHHRQSGREGGSNLYDDITSRIIAELDEGRVPWVRPWASRGTGGALGLPYNAATGRSYSGVNILILWNALFETGFPVQGWLTFRQALALGGHVRKGERGVTVVYADRFTPDEEKARAQEQGDEARSIAFLKRFTVFNIAQCEGLDLAPCDAEPPHGAREIVRIGEDVIAASGIAVRIGGDRAYYAPEADFVAMPPQTAFFDQVNFYAVCLHELTHATGHAKRLDRKILNPFGSKDYAREELVAEMGSAFLCAALGIEPTLRHADYLGSWLDVLREDNRAIVRAASQASKASDWLLTRLTAAHEAGTVGQGRTASWEGAIA